MQGRAGEERRGRDGGRGLLHMQWHREDHPHDHTAEAALHNGAQEELLPQKGPRLHRVRHPAAVQCPAIRPSCLPPTSPVCLPLRGSKGGMFPFSASLAAFTWSNTPLPHPIPFRTGQSLDEVILVDTLDEARVKGQLGKLAGRSRIPVPRESLSDAPHWGPHTPCPSSPAVCQMPLPPRLFRLFLALPLGVMGQAPQVCTRIGRPFAPGDANGEPEREVTGAWWRRLSSLGNGMSSWRSRGLGDPVTW